MLLQMLMKKYTEKILLKTSKDHKGKTVLQ